jgi:hypothetical protein
VPANFVGAFNLSISDRREPDEEFEKQIKESAFEINLTNPVAFGSASKVETFIFRIYNFLNSFAPKVRMNPR